ncbi:MAG: cob(I)yrinic acid a,c-diamide adenosyltransferase [Rhizobiaceae bacterium]
MVILNKIYTKTGDDGSTALGTGERRSKADIRVEAYGTVDEANACIGICRLHLGEENAHLDAMLATIQNDMFDLGADLATPHSQTPPPYEQLRMSENQVTRLESEIDSMTRQLEPLRSFVLPGGSPASAYMHLARTVARRAERLSVELASQEQVTPAALHYLNRLSDFLFVAARVANDGGKGDVLWIPGKNRQD